MTRKRRAMIYCVGAHPKIPDDAGLIIGDAVQSFRSALNFLAWQLAIDNLGREPNDTEAKSIQFPVLSVSKAHSWPNHPHRRYMSATAADVIKKFQPFHVEPQHPPGSAAPLRILADLSNDDKHKVLQVAVSLRSPWSTPSPTPLATAPPL
jgi:hypothetical protein